jgi:hypothetical protein
VEQGLQGQEQQAAGARGVNAARAAQTDPQMGTLYTKMLNGVQASNVDVKYFNAYDLVEIPSQYGSFGHLQYQDEPWTSEPKYNTLMNYTTRR